jgi:hypothetical protein
LHLFDEFIYTDNFSLFDMSAIRIMAVQAAQRTALGKNYKPDSRTIDGSAAFDGMDGTDGLNGSNCGRGSGWIGCSV